VSGYLKDTLFEVMGVKDWKLHVKGTEDKEEETQ
jgi:hypothetical protein